MEIWWCLGQERQRMDNVWNDLPPTLRASSTTLGQFQNKLKTVLFGLWDMIRRSRDCLGCKIEWRLINVLTSYFLTYFTISLCDPFLSLQPSWSLKVSVIIEVDLWMTSFLFCRLLAKNLSLPLPRRSLNFVLALRRKETSFGIKFGASLNVLRTKKASEIRRVGVNRSIVPCAKIWYRDMPPCPPMYTLLCGIIDRQPIRQCLITFYRNLDFQRTRLGWNVELHIPHRVGRRGTKE